MKRLLILLLPLAASVGEAKTFSDTLTTPVGLKISPGKVHDRVEDRSASMDDKSGGGKCYDAFSFFHGNQTVRFTVDNPTSVEQPLLIEFPVSDSQMRLFGRDRDTQCSVVRTVPPGKGRTIDFVLPHFGAMRILCDPSKWRFVDASGRAADASGLLFGQNDVGFKMPLEVCQCDGGLTGLKGTQNLNDFVVAVSPAFADGSSLGARFEKELKQGECARLHGLSVNRPDFTRFRDWRDLACYDALIFAKADWEKATPEFRELTKDYEAAGGKILFAESADEVKVRPLYEDFLEVNRALCGYVDDSSYASDRDAIREANELKHAMPFGAIVLVLLVFSVLAGPVTVFVLAKRGRRIHLLWVFPSVAIVFSLAVALTIIFSNGLSVKVKAFSCETDRPELGRKVVVKNTVYVAPFPMSGPIVCSPTALVTVDSGSSRARGERIVSTPGGLELRGNWAPCLWPVRVRELEVIRTAKEGTK